MEILIKFTNRSDTGMKKGMDGIKGANLPTSHLLGVGKKTRVKNGSLISTQEINEEKSMLEEAIQKTVKAKERYFKENGMVNCINHVIKMWNKRKTET